MVIAVNKIDKEGADPARVRNELAAQGLTPEEWGGDTIYCDVSAKTKQGLDHLLDMILLVAEVEELKANPNAPASGIVIESGLDPGRGPVATVVVQRGTLKAGDALVAGAHWGRVRAMQDFIGKRRRAGRLRASRSRRSASTACRTRARRFAPSTNDRTARQLAEERAHPAEDRGAGAPQTAFRSASRTFSSACGRASPPSSTLI